MKKVLVPLIAAAAIAFAAIAAPSPADARNRGGAIAAGVLGGLALGAIIGSASQPPAYGAPAPVYVAPEPVYEGPVCQIERQRVWVEGLGYRWRRVEVCD